MAENEDKIAQLQARLENLVRTQISFQQEVSRIADELKRLRATPQTPPSTAQQPREYVPPPRVQGNPTPEGPADVPPVYNRPPVRDVPSAGFGQAHRSPRTERPRPAQTATVSGNSTLEKFIGENLISKIGIVVMIIGVAIGAKYAIDRDLISPAARIAIGYLFGFGLLGLAFWLRVKYLNFSAVLVSGAVAILYFITFFAYNLYGLFSQPVAFGLMIAVTIFAVAAAILYNRQVIAHLGLVGAYAVPFLLSKDSGNFAGLFGYIAVINIGILAISVKRYWKALFYTAFVFTWLIFGAWYADAYDPEQHFQLGFTVLSVFFAIFYATFIVYKMVAKESIALENITLVLSNSFLFFGFGIALLTTQTRHAESLGLFCVANAAIHFVVALIVGRFRVFPQDLTYLIIALIVTFATIAVPVQLNGNWIVGVWAVEAAMLFAIGRTKGLAIFEYLSYPLMMLASLSLVRDWLMHLMVPIESFANLRYVPIANGSFATALLFAVAFGLIFYINRDENNDPPIDDDFRQALGVIFAVVALGVFYNALRIEISNYFLAEMASTALPPDGRGYSSRIIVNRALEIASTVWQINFTMLFVAALSFVNMTRWKSSTTAMANIALTILAAGLFVTVGLYELSEPRSSWVPWAYPQYFTLTGYNSALRYLSFLCFGGLFFSFYGMIKQDFVDSLLSEKSRSLIIDGVLFVSLFFIGSSEVIHLGGVFLIDDIEKFGLSIFWGFFALALIALGISLTKKHLRIGGFYVFGLTLAKVFLYDSSGLGTIPKVLVFVALGALLLVASFLYNKYKSLIFGENGDA